MDNAEAESFDGSRMRTAEKKKDNLGGPALIKSFLWESRIGDLMEEEK